MREHEGKWVECLIYAAKGSEEAEIVLEGIFLKEYIIPQEKVKKLIMPSNLNYLGISKDDYLSVNGRSAFKTTDGMLFIYPKKKYKNQQKISFFSILIFITNFNENHKDYKLKRLFKS